MSDPTLAVQKALRARFIATAAVTALVPAASILDRNQRPAPDPSIILGEDQVVDDGVTIMRDYVRVYSTIHIWKKENSLVGVKAISGAIRRAIGRVRMLDLADPDFTCTDCRLDGARFMRDPDGVTSHGVITINCPRATAMDGDDMRAGKLDKTITIERDTASVDAYGTPSTTTATFATARAQIIQQSTDEFIRGFGASDETVTIFRARWIDGVTNADRLIYNGVSHNIKELKEIGRRKGLELRCIAYGSA